MRPEQAELVLDTIMGLWDWVMEDETFKAWKRAICDLQDAETAEYVCHELAKSQVNRPRIAQIVEAYNNDRKKHRKPAWLLSGPEVQGMPRSPSDAWSPEGARWAMGYRHEDADFIERNRLAYLTKELGHELGSRMHASTAAEIRNSLVSQAQAQEAEAAAEAAWKSLGETRDERTAAVKQNLLERIDEIEKKSREELGAK